MIGLDCNILVQLAIADHPGNIARVAAVQTQIQRGELMAVASLVVTEFLHVVTDVKRFDPPLTMVEALNWIEEILNGTSFKHLDLTRESLEQTLRWMREFDLGRKRILDTHLAAILHTAGVNRLLTSNPADFAIFDVLETVTPQADM